MLVRAQLCALPVRWSRSESAYALNARLWRTGNLHRAAFPLKHPRVGACVVCADILASQCNIRLCKLVISVQQMHMGRADNHFSLVNSNPTGKPIRAKVSN